MIVFSRRLGSAWRMHGKAEIAQRKINKFSPSHVFLKPSHAPRTVQITPTSSDYPLAPDQSIAETGQYPLFQAFRQRQK